MVEGYVDKVVWPERLTRYRDFFTDYAARIMADRPANIRTLERYLLLANDLPGLKFSTTLKPSPTHPNASILIVEVIEKPIDALARIDNRGTIARGPWQYLGSADAQQHGRARARGVHASPMRATFQLEELQYLAVGYRQVLNSEGLTVLRQCELRLRAARHRSVAATLDYRTRSTRARGGPELSGDPLAREQSHRRPASAS